MDALRTDDQRFDGLPDWPYAPRYIDDLAGTEGLRMHYVDEGAPGADTVYLCLHGEPSWSYLYRKMIPVFLKSGARVVAPDLFGFGRSDKPVAEEVYTWAFHRHSLKSFIEALDLRHITLVCQDWGGLLGLTLPHDDPGRFERLIVMNTSIAVGQPAGPGFEAWRDYVAATPDLPVGPLLQRGSGDAALSDAEIAAYDAPFPDARYKAGVRRFPQMVMTDPGMEGVDDSKKALDFWRNSWAGQSFMAIGMQDPVLGPPAMAWLREQISGCPTPYEVSGGGHFVQEFGAEIAEAALRSFAR